MKLIQTWLTGKRNFYIGAVLYEHFGTDKKLKELFSGFQNPYKQGRLEQALESLVKIPAEILHGRGKMVDRSEEMPRTNNPVLEALRNEWLPLYQRMQYLRHELDKYEGNSAPVIAQRHPIAKEILDLEQQCMKVWARRDHYLEEGSLPESKTDEDDLPTDPVELGRLIESTKRNIRRNEKLARDNPSNVKYPLNVQFYKDQLERIMKTKNK